MLEASPAYHGIFAKLRMLDIFDGPPTDLYGRELADFYHHFAADFVRDIPLFERFLPGRECRVLDLACGSGRIGIAMARRGARVDGIELSRAMLDLAEESLGQEPPEVQTRMRFIEGDITQFSLAERYDLIILGITTISLLLRTEQRLALFNNVREHLKPAGKFIFDILDLSGDRWKDLNHFLDVWSKEDDAGLDFGIVGQTFFPERRQFVFNVYREFVRWNGTTKRTLGTSVKAWLDRDQLIGEMRETGLQLAEEFDDSIGQHTVKYFVAVTDNEHNQNV